MRPPDKPPPVAPRSALLLLAGALALPLPARAAPAFVQVTGGGGIALAEGAGAGPGGFLRFSVGVDPQLGLAALVGAGLHPVESTRVRLEHVALEAEWRLDRLPVIPALYLGVGALRAVAEGRAGDTLLAYHLTLAVDWWPVAPSSGPSLGLEVRYLGTVEGAFPLSSTFGLRLGWGFR